jgi:hypothetical protein
MLHSPAYALSALHEEETRLQRSIISQDYGAVGLDAREQLYVATLPQDSGSIKVA